MPALFAKTERFMRETLLDAVIDTLKLAPIIVATYILIELVESKFAARVTKSRALFSHAAPALGAAVGIVPQCGFSVISANLYSAGKISLGTLLAVFIATSDEAVPVLLADYHNAYKLLPLLAVKFVLALVVGYAVHFLLPHGFGLKSAKARKNVVGISSVATGNVAVETSEGTHDHDDADDRDEHKHDEQADPGMCGCHGHSVTGKTDVKELFLHPLIHSLTVLGFILAVNVAFGIVIYYVGEDRLSEFLGKTAVLQPFVATLIGLIPNCAASVVITKLYAMGGLTLGSAVAGLGAGAGIGYAVLFKENKNIRENLAIVAFMYVVCVGAGLLTDLLASLF